MPDEGKRGRRVYNWTGSPLLRPGDYAIHEGCGDWYACTPNGHMANLAGHLVVEHDNGTISVTPGIRVFRNRRHKPGEQTLWDGYLSEGCWCPK
jgi:hypothetical protein